MHSDSNIEKEKEFVMHVIYDWKDILTAQNKRVEIVSYEDQNKAYGGCVVRVDDVLHRIRIAKITPRKSGQFVAIWQKDQMNKNEPFDVSASPAFLTVFVFSGDMSGAFMFPKEVLKKKGIYRSDGSCGKMAFRLYPPWDVPTSKQAVRTQAWQCSYFQSF